MANQPYVIAKPILEKLAGQTLPDWHRIEAASHVARVKAGEFLFRMDEQHPSVYFVGEGIIKMVYETIDGKQWIKAFAEPGRFFASLTALEPGGRTGFAALAVSEAVVERVPYKLLQELGDAYLPWQGALRRAFEIYGFRKETRERELLTLSAEERYRLFIAKHAELAAALSDKDLAGYIRVTPVALSRIKGRIRRSDKGVNKIDK